jgi:hypothetical protein
MHRRFTAIVLIALLGFGVLAVPGCASNSASRGANAPATDGLTRTAAAIRLATDQLQATRASMARLRSMDGADPPGLFADSRRNLESLETLAGRVDATSTRMRADAEAFFATWNEQLAVIENVAIRDRSEQRRQLIERSLRGLLVDHGRLSDDHGRFVADLRDIRSALSVDLTADGGAAYRAAGVSRSGARS